MSVAFRREGDDEHKEPRFELPIPPGPNLVTASGLAQIEAHVAELEALAKPSEEQRRDLRYWRRRLATAQLARSTAQRRGRRSPLRASSCWRRSRADRTAGDVSPAPSP